MNSINVVAPQPVNFTSGEPGKLDYNSKVIEDEFPTMQPPLYSSTDPRNYATQDTGWPPGGIVKIGRAHV